MNFALIKFLIIIGSLLLAAEAEAGLIKNIFQKVTGTGGNKTDSDTVKQSAPICGSNIFATANENAVSPEIIFITNRPSRTVAQSGGYPGGNNYGNNQQQEARHRDETARGKLSQVDVDEVAKEFRFNAENVTLEELERNGFNPDGPVTFLMHGFTSGYPLQAWMSAIVEAYTIDRESNRNNFHASSHHNGGQNNQYGKEDAHYNNNGRSSHVNHNLFVINWNYAARGIHYARAVANIPVVATYVTRFINERLLGDARIDPDRIQLIGHSLGAHLAGFIGKNTRSKLGRIYGLDPAGPCFGAISGPLYPASQRLASGDALEVITLHTNTALLGINKPLGKYSVFVEGGSQQPGCKGGGGILESLNTLTWDGATFDTLACSHSRAPNLLTYRYDQSDTEDDCQLMAFECKDWDSYLAGHCGYCSTGSSNNQQQGNYSGSRDQAPLGPLQPVECLRIGLDWQYPTGKKSGRENGGYSSGRSSTTTRRPTSSGYSDNDDEPPSRTTTRRPTPSGYSDNDDEPPSRTTTRRPTPSGYSDNDDEPPSITTTRRPTSSGYSDNDDEPPSLTTTRRPTPSGYSDNDDEPPSLTTTRRPTPSGYSDNDDEPPSRTRRPFGHSNSNLSNQSGRGTSTTRLPWEDSGYQSPSSYNDYSRRDNDQPVGDRNSLSPEARRSATRRPSSSSSSQQRNRRDSGQVDPSERRRENDDSKSNSNKIMFLRTGDTQPYCAYQYQVVLELNEPFPKKKKPPISLVLQDSDSLREQADHGGQHGAGKAEQNSITNDEFGNKFDDRTYTHLLTSSKKLKRVDHATLLFRDSLPDGFRVLKALYVNYMSHENASVRQRFSSRLCPVKTENDSGKDFSTGKRFYFKPCDDQRQPIGSGPETGYRPQSQVGQTSRKPTQWA